MIMRAGFGSNKFGRMIVASVLLTAAISCKMLAPSSLHSEVAHVENDWEMQRRDRDDARQSYFKTKADSLRSFLETPVGYDGMPAIIFALLPELVPDIWAPDIASKQIGITYDTSRSAALPRELHVGPGSVPGLNIANFSCATCHVGHVSVAGQEVAIIGAPNTRLDTAAFRYQLWRTINDQRFNAAAIRALLATKKPGWLYGTSQSDLEQAETKIIDAQAEMLVDQLKKQLNIREDTVKKTLGAYTYARLPDLLNGGVPGAMDAFGFTVASLLTPPDLSSRSGDEQHKVLHDLLPTQPPMVDIMSIWEQNSREYAQWDGSIKAKLIRNLGAELGVIRDPSKVNRANAAVATDFIGAMPPPAYPFPVDMKKAAAGREIFVRACQRCHDHGTFVPLDILSVDGNRARGLTVVARKGLIAGLRAACGDTVAVECSVSDEDILLDRSALPGYTAPSLAGIWARSPYLHNGSVPTIYHMLVPKERPISFKRGDISFDEVKLGFDYDAGRAAGKILDTTWPGFSRTGHDIRDVFFGGIDFGVEQAKREHLIEYLKTL